MNLSTNIAFVTSFWLFLLQERSLKRFQTIILSCWFFTNFVMSKSNTEYCYSGVSRDVFLCHLCGWLPDKSHQCCFIQGNCCSPVHDRAPWAHKQVLSSGLSTAATLGPCSKEYSNGDVGCRGRTTLEMEWGFCSPVIWLMLWNKCSSEEQWKWVSVTLF